jgi:bacterial/archaeal transporter family protein
MDRTLISILGGLGGMFGWGTADFLANDASEKIGHTRTFFWSQIAGVILISLLVIFLAPHFSFTPFLLALTVLGGIMYGIGYLFFYKGFEVGNVSVVSTVSNLYALFVVLISFFFRGQRLTPLQIPAILLLFAGVFLVSVNYKELFSGKVTLMKGVKETFISTIAFGVFFWPLNEFIVEQIDWLAVSVVTKITAVIFVLLFSIFLEKKSLKIKKDLKKISPLLLGMGLLEALAVLSVTFGQAYGDGIIVSPIASALTIVTVGLAIVFAKEKISKVQAMGIVFVITGIVIMTH